MSVRRGLVSLLGSVLAASVFLSTAQQLPAPPVSDLHAVDEWWRTSGTAVATFSVLRVTGLALCAYIGVLGLLGTVAALTRWNWVATVWRRCATPGARRLLAGGGLVAGLSLPTIGAADSGSAVTPFELTDVGPTPSRFELTDVGPTPTEPATTDIEPLPIEPATTDIEPTPTEPATTDIEPTPRGPIPRDTEPERAPPRTEAPAGPDLVEIWVVGRGDHLWAIAAETVTDRGGDPTDANVADYWRRLIERNQAAVGQDPDLIHPGQVIYLPE